MQDPEHAFLEFAINSGVLRFGEFTLKSGRVSPYFFNVGLLNTGQTLSRLARFYASALNNAEPEPFMLFGPAYKGIPLAAATATALAEHHGRNTGFAFNRKEPKDHGEGGQLVGAELTGSVVIIDDVITAGTSVRESVEIICNAGATPVAVMIALDREEKMTEDGHSAITVVREQWNLRVHALARLSNLLEYLATSPDLSHHLPALENYQRRYS